MNIVERRRPQDGQITMVVDNREIDIRVSTVATIWGESCVLRVLDKSRSLFRMGDLGMPLETHEVFTRLIGAPFGMVLCAGPTGSGKTTTLYAALTEIDDPSRNIMTVEDPVEYVFPTINQIQTNDQAGITFANGLRSILRQDPDVILVGEIRDVETARIAVQSALTGHFVLSSLHATDSAAALHRFLDMGIESFLVASSVLAIVSQRLVRRICQTCKTPYEPKDEELAFYQESGGLPKQQFLQRRRLQLLRGDRIPGPHRRLRAHAHHTRDQAADRGVGHPGRAAAHGGVPGHADTSRRSDPSHHRRRHHDLRSRSVDLHSLRAERSWRSTNSRAITPDGTTVTGVEDALTPSLARRALIGRDLSPVEVIEKKNILRFEITREKVPRKELMYFSRQMAVFMKAGIPVLEALEIMSEESGQQGPPAGDGGNG